MGFLVPIKSTTTTEGGKKGGVVGKEKNLKECTEQVKKIRIINVFLESLLSESFPSLEVMVHLIPLGCPPTLC